MKSMSNSADFGRKNNAFRTSNQLMTARENKHMPDKHAIHPVFKRCFADNSQMRFLESLPNSGKETVMP